MKRDRNTCSLRPKTPRQLMVMRETGALLAEVFEELKSFVKPGLTTSEIDLFVEKELSKRKLVSQAKGYKGYGHVSCISVNEEVVHGVPSSSRIIAENDLIKIDICAKQGGLCADMTRCFVAGLSNKRLDRFVKTAYAAEDAGIACMVAGGYVGDISAAIQNAVESQGYQVVRDFAGHGIGCCMHEAPEVLNFGRMGTGPQLVEGIALAIEPIIAEGDYAVKIQPDGWTAVTVDGLYAAHVEDTVIITKHGPEIITKL